MAEKAVEIEGLSYVYPDGKEVLCNINLDVFRGESIGIIGANGAGKTTLLLHLNGILRGEGSIRILGLDMEDRNLTRIRSKVGLVFQDPDNQLFMPTVFDDVAFGPLNMALPQNEVEVSVHQALEEVGMLEAIQRISHHLSFGEKKRVAMATVLAMSPEILVLDEPTSNLDPQGRDNIIRLLKGINKTKIIASHDRDMVSRLCSRVIHLEKGRIMESGCREANPLLVKQ